MSFMFFSYFLLLLINVTVSFPRLLAIYSCFPVIRFLRVDTLSLLLSMANVSANSDVLVVDMVGGLLTGAVAERLGGFSMPMLLNWVSLSGFGICRISESLEQ